MQIKQGKNKFFIGEDEQNPTAVLDYRPHSDKVIEAYHTLVKPELKGQGIAGKLFDKLIEYAEANDLKIIPSCSYVEKKMKSDDKYKERIAE